MKRILLQTVGITFLSFIFMLFVSDYWASMAFQHMSQYFDFCLTVVLSLLITIIILLIRIYAELKKPK